MSQNILLKLHIFPTSMFHCIVDEQGNAQTLQLPFILHNYQGKFQRLVESHRTLSLFSHFA